VQTQRIGRIGSAEIDLVTGEMHGSEELFKIYGLEPSVGTPSIEQLFAMVHPDDRAMVQEVRDQNMRGFAADVPIDFRIIRPDGETRWLHREVELIRDADGKPTKMIATQQDITERRRIVEEIRQGREHLELAQRIAKIGSVEVNLRTGAVKWSAELCRIYGLDPATAVPSLETFIARVHPDDRETLLHVDSQSGHGSQVEPFEFRIVRTDGEVRWIYRHAAILLDEKGAPDIVIITNEDVTDRKRIEDEVRRSREHLEHAQRTARIGSAEVNLRTGEEFWSDEMCHLFGVDPHVTKPGFEHFIAAVHPDDRATLREHRGLNGRGIATEPAEYRIIGPDGVQRWIRRAAEIFRDDGGLPVRIVATHLDISDRKRMEEALRHSNEHLARAQRVGAVGSSEVNLRTGKVIWTDYVFTLLGLDPAVHAPGFDTLLTVVHPDDQDMMRQVYRDNHNDLDVGPLEFRVVRPSGQVRWLERVSELFRDAEGSAHTLVVTLHDITERKRVASDLNERETQLRVSREHLARAQRVGAFGSAEVNIETGAVMWTDQIYSLLDLDPATVAPSLEAFVSAIHPGDRAMVHQAALKNREGVEVPPMEFRTVAADGSLRWFSWAADLLPGEDGKAHTVIATIHDITQRKRAEAELRERERRLARSERHLALAQRIGAVGSIERYLPDGQAFWSDEFYRLTGLDPAKTEIKPESLLGIVHPEDRAHVGELIAKARSGQHTDPYEFRIVRPDGEIRWVSRISEHLRRDDGTVYAYFATFFDITKRKHDEERIVYQANYDALTGLPNRSLFVNRLSHAINAAGRGPRRIAVLFIDLDGFKMVNDTMGHDIGDELLSEAARRLLASFRAGDTVARFGGDEFVVLMAIPSSLADVPTAAQRVITAMQEPFRLRTYETFVSASIGIAVYPDDATDVNSLLANADAAMYRAKEMGKANFQFFTAGLNDRMHERMAIKQALARALDRGEFELHYQPKFDLRTGKLTGVEALLRWRNAELGEVDPETFIPVMEETGMIVTAGEWVLASACTQYKKWLDAGYPGIRVAVNMSVRQLRQPNLADTIGGILDRAGVDPSCLELEITESTVMKDTENAIAVLRSLRDMGITLAMDDFGTGYSSLGYLKKLPLQTIKIDRSFISDIADNPDDREITRTIINLGHGLHYRVVAEGVETVEQSSLLREFDCDEVQGFLLGRPVAAGEIEKLLATLVERPPPSYADTLQLVSTDKADPRY
jgi:diguanylate cyclase (GGDEF)-like protein/PAS domain S-box-containing protein